MTTAWRVAFKTKGGYVEQHEDYLDLLAAAIRAAQLRRDGLDVLVYRVNLEAA